MNLTPQDLQNIAHLLEEAKRKYGKAALERIEDTFATVAGMRQRVEPEDPYQRGAEVVFPDLTAKAWYESHELEIAKRLEASWETIRAELDVVLERRRGFQQYVRYNLDDSRTDVPEQWKALYLKEGPETFPHNRELCPETTKIIADDPRLGDLAIFSALNPGGHIAPHHATFNYQLNIHLGLIIPEDDCALRVGGEARKWEEGKCLVFDASFEHEAWNRSDSTRFVFFINYWHPELSDAEVDVLTKAYSIVGSEEAAQHNYALQVGKESLVNQQWWV